MKSANINREIGNRIKIARISRNLGQESVAEDLGISVSAYSNMERGAVDITVTRVQQVADILKVNWLYLIGVSQQIMEGSFGVGMNTIEDFSANKYGQNTPMDFGKEIQLLKEEIRMLKKNKGR